MDIVKFQEMLNGICALAGQNQNLLTMEQVRTCFADAALTKELLSKVFQYLRLKGIEIEGAKDCIRQDAAESPEEKGEAEAKEQRVLLTPEEEAYLQEYLEGLSEAPLGVRSREELFAAASAGEELARQELIQRYLPVAAKLAAEKNCAEIMLPDLIQEANISLLTALEEAGAWGGKASGTENAEADGDGTGLIDEEWLLQKIRQGIDDAIALQSEQKFADDCLVAKVEKLEAAVRELSDDEDGGGTTFSVEELAIILDMDGDEIRKVLRLTGDDK